MATLETPIGGFAYPSGRVTVDREGAENALNLRGAVPLPPTGGTGH